MAKLLRWAGYVLGVPVALILLGVIAVYGLSQRALAERVTPKPSHLATPSAAQLADGPRQLRVLGCLTCHGEGLKGNLFFDEAGVAKLYAPNVTLIAATATDQQLDQAIRQGIGHDGRSLFVMPSSQYQFLSDAEVAALISAIRLQPKGGEQTPEVSVGPLGRIGLVTGKFNTAPRLVAEYSEAPLADFGPQFARGRHLIQTNCTECHGPQLQGKEVKPGSISPDLSIAGAYDLDQFKTLLQKGIAPGDKKIPLMGSVARTDFSHMTDKEIAAIHAYLVERAQRAP